MQYRKFGKLDWEVSALGFGAMRLPTIGGVFANIDEPEAIRMIRYAIDHGVNYVDTAYLYHEGNSERVVGKALKDGYREKTRIATKLPCMRIHSADEFDSHLNEQLERLQVEQIDFYLLHGLNAVSWSRMHGLNVLDWAEKMMARGHIAHLGFSFHDELAVFKDIIDAYDNWTFCQIQYNFMDIDNQAGRSGLEYATSRDLAVVVMEPLRGGLLATAPEPVARVWATEPRKASPVEWSLLWVWNHPEVSLALSGMSTMEQVVQNVDIAGRSGPGTLSRDELALIYRVREAYRNIMPIPCTKCGYCTPCPNGVDIPRIFEVYNEATMYNSHRMGRFRYIGPMGLKEEQRADQCTECGECMEACPQKIEIPDWLKKAHEWLSEEV